MHRLVVPLAVLLLPAVLHASDGVLNPFLTEAVRGGGWVAKGAAYSGRDGGPKSEAQIAFEALPGGAVVKHAYLYWTITSGTDPTATVNGTPVTGTQIGASQGCSSRPVTGYRADVTSLMLTGATEYVIAGLPSASSGPDTDGVGILIIWENPAVAEETLFFLRDGAATRIDGNGVAFDANGFTVPPNISKGEFLSFTDAETSILVNNGEPGVSSVSERSTSASRWYTTAYDVKATLDPGETTFSALTGSGFCFVQTVGMMTITLPICNGTTSPSGATGSTSPAQDALQGFLTETIRGGGVVSAGKGFGGRKESGTNVPVTQQTLTIAGIPAGASVRHAYLYWATYGVVDDTATIDGFAVQGSAIGVGAPTCWVDGGLAASNTGFRADVTARVNGNGSYIIAGLPSAQAAAPDVPDSQGVSLVVIYGDPAADHDTSVVIAEGTQSVVNFAPLAQTIPIPTVPITPTHAELLLLVGDGQASLGDGQLSINGMQLSPMAPRTAHYPGFDGGFWDNYSLDVTPHITAGDTDVLVRQNFFSDCLVFVATVISYTVPAESGAGPECGGAFTTTTLPSGSTTTTTFPGATTTTTLPAGAEQCGNCQDDDGDGLTDLEDSDCCQTGVLTLTRARLKPSKKVAGATTTNLKLRLPDPGLAVVDPSAQDTVLQLHRRGGGFDYCARIPAANVIGKKAKNYRFKDPRGSVASAAGISKVVLKRKKGGTLLATLVGKSAKFATPTPGQLAITLAFAGGDGAKHCVGVQPQFVPQGKKGVLRAP